MKNNIIKLDAPIKINGVECTELTFNYFEITNDLYLEAAMRSSRVGNTMNTAAVRELNEALAFCLGKAAIIAANPKISWEDLDHLKGFALLDVANVGRFFISRKRVDFGQNPSGEQSEDTPNDSTQASEKSDK